MTVSQLRQFPDGRRTDFPQKSGKEKQSREAKENNKSLVEEKKKSESRKKATTEELGEK